MWLYLPPDMQRSLSICYSFGKKELRTYLKHLADIVKGMAAGTSLDIHQGVPNLMLLNCSTLDLLGQA